VNKDLCNSFYIILIILAFSIINVNLITQQTNEDSTNFVESLSSISNFKETNFNSLDDHVLNQINNHLYSYPNGFEHHPQKIDYSEEIYFEIEYTLRNQNLAIGFAKSEVLFAIPESIFNNQYQIHDQELYDEDHDFSIDENSKYILVKLSFLDSFEVSPVASKPQQQSNIYRISMNQDTNSPETSQLINYQKLIYPSIYPNIDLHYILTDGQLKYEFYVHPGGNFKDIKLHWQLVEIETYQNSMVSVSLSQEGMALKLKQTNMVNEVGSLILFVDNHPINFIGKDRSKLIDGEFLFINNNTYGFVIDELTYNRNELLIIDPYILPYYSSYLGGSERDEAHSIYIDDEKNYYLTGFTRSLNFPIYNPYQEDFAGGYNDAFLTKFYFNGSLAFSTFFGGGAWDQGRDIVVDESGNIFVIGSTFSDDFPVLNAYQENRNGFYSNSYDTFLIKFNSTGNGILFSTYFGGNSTDHGYAIALDSESNVLIAGTTSSYDFHILNAYFDTYSGFSTSYHDSYLAKFSNTGSLMFSTFYGGNYTDHVGGITIGNDNSIYLFGHSTSSDLPVLNGLFNESPSNESYLDVYITKFENNGNFSSGSYFGGNCSEFSGDITSDNQNNIYITGRTCSQNFPTVNAYQEELNGYYNIFVTKLNANLSEIIYSTYIGGSQDDYGNSISVDDWGRVYVGGYSSSSDFPTVNSFQEEKISHTDGILFVFGEDGSELLYSTFIGGSGGSVYVRDIQVIQDYVFLVGYTFSSNFPIFNGYQTSYGGSGDAFVFIFQPDPYVPILNNISSTYSYEFGSEGNLIEWEGYDDFPDTYDILVNGEFVESGLWENNITNYFNVDYLDLGNNNVTIINYDKLGNMINETIVITVVDTTPPDIQISPSEFTYEIGTFLYWTVFDLLPDYFEILRNGTLVSINMWYTSEIEFQLIVPETGFYNITLITYDTSGNFDVDTIMINVVDLTEPLLVSTSATTIFEYGDNTSIYWVLFDYLPDFYQIYLNGTLVNGNSWTSNKEVNFTFFNLDLGYHNITLLTVDTSGNDFIHTKIIQVVDTTPPILLSLTNEETFEYGEIGNYLFWEFFDLLPNNYVIYLNQTEVRVGLWNDNNTIYFPLDDLILGKYNFTIIGYDTSGNYLIHQLIISIVDTTPPEILTVPMDYISEDELLTTVSWTAYDLLPNYYYIYFDGIQVKTGNWTNDAIVTLNLLDLELELGEFEILIEFYDTSNNKVSHKFTIQITPDYFDPEDIGDDEDETDDEDNKGNDEMDGNQEIGSPFDFDFDEVQIRSIIATISVGVLMMAFIIILSSKTKK
jgi:hypothetical protein